MDEPAGSFPSTHWSIIAAAQAQSPEARVALGRLCERYWYPIYAFIRRRVHDRHRAEDLTQDFFEDIVGGTMLKHADPKRGRFRSFLLACCGNHVLSAHRYATAAKRAGSQTILSLDFRHADEQYRLEPADNVDAEQLFNRRWAMGILAETFATLEGEYALRKRSPWFDHLKAYLTGDDDAGYATIAEMVGSTEDAIKKEASRFRQRFAEILREKVGMGLSDPNDVDDEIRQLMAVVSC